MKKSENEITKMKKKRRLLVFIGISVQLVVCVLVIAGIFLYKQKASEEKIAFTEQQLESGEQYLEKEEYEKAIVAYKNAIENDNLCEDGYLGLAEVYIEQEEYEEAEKVYLEAQDILTSSKIDRKLKTLQNLIERYLETKEAVEAADAAIEAAEAAAEAAAEVATEVTVEETIEETEEEKAIKEQLVDEGSVINIYCWNEEFQQRFNDYYRVPEGITINWVITPTQDNGYQRNLDEALLNQEYASPNDKIDIFLVEADYALKYVDTPYTANVKTTIGLSGEDLSGMFQYTKDIMTDSRGVLKGVSWQACPAGFIYRRSIAKKVLGTDDPAEVQAALNSWEKFDAVAADAKAKGYFMLSGFDDAYRVFSNNSSTPWVVDEKIVVSDEIKEWVAQTKTYTDKSYNNQANLWSPESGAGAQANVFGYFGPGWFVDYCLLGWSLADYDAKKAVGNGTYGDWALCKGPQGSFWGGSWICVATGTDNAATVNDILYTLTCDKDVLLDIAMEKGDFVNNKTVMKKIANSDYAHPFLGGQNHISAYLDSANSVDMSNATAYDQVLNQSFQSAMMEYFKGNETEKEAYQNFYDDMIYRYPNLSY